MGFRTSTVVMDRTENRNKFSQGIVGRLANLYSSPKSLVMNKHRGNNHQKRSGCTLVMLKSKPEPSVGAAGGTPFGSASVAKSRSEVEHTVANTAPSTESTSVPVLQPEPRPTPSPVTSTTISTSAATGADVSCSPSVLSLPSQAPPISTPTVSPSKCLPVTVPTTCNENSDVGAAIEAAKTKSGVQSIVKNIYEPDVNQNKMCSQYKADTNLRDDGDRVSSEKCVSVAPSVKNNSLSNGDKVTTCVKNDRTVKNETCLDGGQSITSDSNSGSKPSVMATLKAGGGTGKNSRHRRQDEGSFVFNFSDRQGKPNYVDDDGKLRHRRAVPEFNDHSYVVLNSASGEGKHLADEMRELQHVLQRPPSICDAEFVNADILIANRSSLMSHQQGDKPITKSVSFCSRTPIIHNYPAEDIEMSS